MTNNISVAGCTSLTGNRFVKISAGISDCYIEWKRFGGNKTKIREDLAESGIVVVHDADWRRVVDKVAKVRFPKRRLLEQPGWSGGHFSLPDGTVFGPGPKVRVLFSVSSDCVKRKGSLDGWKINVADLLVGQHLLSFLTMAAFASPILALTNRTQNIGFELVGKGGSGKSTAQYVMASVFGSALNLDGTDFWISFNKTIAAIDALAPSYNHLPMIFDEANLIAGGGTSKERGEFRALVFKLAEGATKVTAHNPVQRTFRTVWMTSANEPLSSLIADGDASTNAAAGDRLITLAMNDSAPYGTFTRIPDGTTPFELAGTIRQGIKDNYGTAGPAFLKALVSARVVNETALRARIKRDVDKFKNAVGTDPNDGSASRVAEAFGIVYASGMLAKAYGVLPRGFRCLAAAKTAYKMNRPISEEAILTGQLAQLLKTPGLKNLSKGKRLLRMSDSTLHSTAVFVNTGKGGRQELLVSPLAFRAKVPNASSLLKQAIRFNRLHHPDKSHKTVHRRVRKDKRDRMLCFLIDGL